MGDIAGDELYKLTVFVIEIPIIQIHRQGAAPSANRGAQIQNGLRYLWRFWKKERTFSFCLFLLL